mmetsp:Transcript_2940/g.5995  ORF Transcript_2940/g.5995 Transcript_2940/m.5995 type:complete len:92 (-) Transcript_2940:1043-1318(-)
MACIVPKMRVFNETELLSVKVRFFTTFLKAQRSKPKILFLQLFSNSVTEFISTHRLAFPKNPPKTSHHQRHDHSIQQSIRDTRLRKHLQCQ